MPLTVAEIRECTTQAVLHTRGEAYGAAQLDRAAQMALGLLVNETKCIVRRSTATLEQGEMEFDWSEVSDLDGFMPAFFARARVGVHELDRVDVDFVRNRLRATAQTDGTPSHIGFETLAAGLVWPVPDADYTVSVVWHPGLTLWTPGTMAHVEIDIPRRILDPAVWAGCAAALVYGEATGNPWPTTGWRLFLDYIEKVKGYASVEGSIGPSHPYNPPPPARQGRRQSVTATEGQ